MQEINNSWIIHKTIQETEKIASKLEELLRKKQQQEIVFLLSSPANLRSLVIRNGEKNAYIKVLLEAFVFLLGEEFGDKKIANIKSSKILDFIHREGLPEKLLAEILAANFHLKNEEVFFDVLKVIKENKNSFRDREVFAYALNIYAAWLGSFENKHEENLEVNKMVLDLARKNSLRVLECKALFALSDHKAYRKEKKLKPRKQVEDYKRLSKKFLELGNDYDALRCDIETALGYMRLSNNQTDEEREKTLKKALLIAKKAQKKSREMGYPKAFLRIKTILSYIYKEKGNELQAIRYAKEAEKLRGNYF